MLKKMKPSTREHCCSDKEEDLGSHSVTLTPGAQTRAKPVQTPSSLSACVLYLLTPHVINTVNQKQMWFAPHSSKKKQTPNTAFVSCSWNKAQDPGNCSISISWPLVYLVSVICMRSGEGAYFEAWQNTWLPVGNTSSLTERKLNTGEVLTQRVNIILGH